MIGRLKSRESSLLAFQLCAGYSQAGSFKNAQFIGMPFTRSDFVREYCWVIVALFRAGGNQLKPKSVSTFDRI